MLSGLILSDFCNSIKFIIKPALLILWSKQKFLPNLTECGLSTDISLLWIYARIFFLYYWNNMNWKLSQLTNLWYKYRGIITIITLVIERFYCYFFNLFCFRFQHIFCFLAHQTSTLNLDLIAHKQSQNSLSILTCSTATTFWEYQSLVFVKLIYKLIVQTNLIIKMKFILCNLFKRLFSMYIFSRFIIIKRRFIDACSLLNYSDNWIH